MSCSIAIWISMSALALAGCQPPQPFPPPPHHDEPLPISNPTITAQGTVLSVERPHPEDSQTFVHLVITPPDKQPIRAVLGPGWYLDKQGMRFEPNDVVRVAGRPSKHAGQAAIEVQELEQGGHHYLLRDPEWHGAWETSPSTAAIAPSGAKAAPAAPRATP